MAGLVLVTPQPALAHLHLRRSVPAAQAVLDTVPRDIRLVFSEPPELGISFIRLFAPDGSPVALGALALDSSQANTLVIPLAASTLSPGTYTVSWRTASPDGHPVEGKYTFEIAAGAVGLAVSPPAAPVAPPGAGAASADSLSPSLPAAGGQLQASGLAVESPVYVAVRWLNYAALFALMGAVAFALFIAPRVPAVALPASLGAARLGIAAAAVLVVAALARLLAQSYALRGAGIGAIVGGTMWGRAWLLGAAASVAALAAIASVRGTGRRAGWLVALAAVVAFALSLPLSGHAVATPRLAPLAVAADSLHILGAGGWLGTLLALVMIGVPITLRGDPGTRGRDAARLVNVFSPVALGCAALLAITGLLAAWLHLGALAELWQSRYGQVLIAKLAVIALLAVMAYINWRVLRPALGDDRATRRLRGTAGVELALATLVLVVTAVLVATPPPTEAGNAAAPVAAVSPGAPER